MIDDWSIERTLREPPPDEPMYRVGRLGWDSRGRPTTHRPRRAGVAWRAIATVGSVALLLVLLLGLAAIMSGAINRPDLLRTVDEAGALRVAIRPDAPQALTTSLEGFDIDVAKAVAAQAGLASAMVPTAAAEMAADNGSTWDVAMPSDAMIASDSRLIAGPAYYRWPAYLVVPSASGATVIADLAGRRICVTEGSAGAAWIEQRTDPFVTVTAPPPATATGVVRPDDQACLDALVNGQADAMVSARTSLADLATRPSTRNLGTVLSESRTFVAARSGADPSALLDRIGAALSVLRADGTLADLSRSRFGGIDLTPLP